MRFLFDPEASSGNSVDETIETLRAIAVASPDLPSVWVRLAESLEVVGAPEQAIDAWRMAHRLVPNSARISTSLRRLESEHVGAETQNPTKAVASIPDSQPEEEPSQARTADRQQASLDLDLLISDLQSGRSLTESEHSVADSDPVAQTEDEEIATETLAKIFESQKLFADAARIFDLLADREENAVKAETQRARAKDLRKRIV